VTGVAANVNSVPRFPKTVNEDRLQLPVATYSDSSVKIPLLVSCELNI